MERQVNVFVSPGNHIGLSLSNDHVVTDINDNSPLVGKISRGDRVTFVNGISLQQFTGAKLLEFIKELHGEVTLTIGRETAAPAPPTITVDESETPSHMRRTRMRRMPVITNELEKGSVVSVPAPGESAPGSSKGSPSKGSPGKGSPGKGSPTKPSSANQLRAQFEASGHRLSFTPEAPVHAKHPPIQASRTIDFGELPQWRRTNQPVVTLHNYTNGEQTVDKLHTEEGQIKVTGCTAQGCKGSLIMPKEHKTCKPNGEPRGKEEMKILAKDYLQQYFVSRKHALHGSVNEKLALRLAQVNKEIDDKGHYNLTYEELAYGARLAWRNAPRCVNRIIWRQLELLDARDATTPKEMYDAICHHLKYATNGGNIRSTITLFQHRTGPGTDFRVWNSQLIKYAGYKQGDGSIMGDPDQVEFTEVCMKLGWRPPNDRPGRFDILPLVLQANGGTPEWFEIPKELILEVKITHPTYKWFESMNLRWYAVPAVANIMLDIGGLQYTAAPFNGWYMSSEIASRNFGDVYRYNLLKPVAENMGLDTQSYKLWKDRAMVELNVAVLHSYQKAGVSIVDHHSATESFMTFFKSEAATRGGCPADWVWLVPPISGSATPVFHQEMLLYYLNPSYEYQEEPWKYTHLPGEVPRFKHKLKAVARMVLESSRLMKGVMDRRVKATILYATETGRSKSYANVVKNLFDRAFACKVICMDEYNRANLEHEQLLLVVTSTFGSGDPPANGELFGRYLLDMRNGRMMTGAAPSRRNQRISTVVAPSREMLEKAMEDHTTPLSQVKFAVFGLGSRAYPHFCAFAHTVDSLLLGLGAKQVCPCGEGDELCGQEESFKAWLRECYLHSCEVYSLDPRMSEDEALQVQPKVTRDSYRVSIYTGSEARKGVCQGLSIVHGKKVYSARLKNRKKLQPSNSDRSTLLIKLEAKSGLGYIPGDHVAMYPQNHPVRVNELLDRLKLSTTEDEFIDPDTPIVVESKRKNSNTSEIVWAAESRLPVPVTIREAFTYYLDITNPPTPELLHLFAMMASRKHDQDELNELAKGGDYYEDWKFGRFPNIMEVFNNHHSLKLDMQMLSILLLHLPILQCRYYSISSSPRVCKEEIHATVAVVKFKKRNGSGPTHHGVCSTWLNRIDIGSEVPCTVRKAHAFRLPEDSRAPVVMVGPGTGIAPFRAFWQERTYQRNEALKAQLKSSTGTMTSFVVSSPKNKQFPDTPANRVSITMMQPPGGERKRSRGVSTVVVPVGLTIPISPQAPVPDLTEDDEEEEEEEDDNTFDGPEEEMTEEQAAARKRSADRRLNKRKLSRYRLLSRMKRSASDENQSKYIAELLNARQQMWGSMSLYFGCRQNDLDHIYRDEITKAQLSGALTDVHIGFSREPGRPKTYVQHLLRKNADTIVRQLIEERGHFYVCGDISMAADVGRTLQNIFEENAAMSPDEARKIIDSMKEGGTYHEDIFGVTLKTAEVTTRVRTAAKKAWRILVTAADSQTPLTPLPSGSNRFNISPPTPSDIGTRTLGRGSKRPTVAVLMSPPTSETHLITPPVQQKRVESVPTFNPSGKRKTKGMTLTVQEEEEDEPKKEGLKIMDLHGGPPVRSILDPSSPVDPPSPSASPLHHHPTSLMISSPERDGRRRRKMRAIKSLSLVQSDV